MMGFSYAVRQRQRQALPMIGDFRRAETFVEDYHRYTLGLQNADGSFSTEWFNRAADNGDPERKLYTTGHILEWLAYSLSDKQLGDRRVARAAEYLTSTLLANPDRDWEIGALGHGLHALMLLDQRMFHCWQGPSATAASAASASEKSPAAATPIVVRPPEPAAD
jgi:hypothetical protein